MRIVTKAAALAAALALALTGVGSAFATEAVDKPEVPSCSLQVRDVDGTWGDFATASVNDEVDWRVRTTIPADIDLTAGDTVTFNVTADAGAPIDVSTVKVTVMSADTAKASCVLPLAYAEPYSQPGTVLESPDVKATGGGTEMTVQVSNLASHVTSGDTVEVSYSGTVNPDKATTGIANAMANKATVTYPDATGAKATTEADDAEVATFAVELHKVGKEGKDLPDAVFALRESGTNKVFQLDGKWAEKYDASTCDFVSDGTGSVKFVGLGAGTYQVVESKAPEGYAKPDKLMTLKVTSDGKTFSVEADHSLAKVETVDANKGTATVSFENKEGTSTSGTDKTSDPFEKKGSLTSTGDFTMWLIVGGAVCVALAIGIFLYMRRSRNDEE